VSTLVVGLPNNNPAYRTETRGDGPARTFVYTSVGHVTWVSDFTAHQSSQTYDTTTKYINSVTDFNGHTTDFTCDAVTGNITQIKYPLTNGDTPGQGNTRPTVNYSYTNNYYLHTIQDEGNHTTTFTRDANNRVTEIDYPDSGYETFSYTGNSFGEVTAHRMTTAGIETFTYDARGLKQTYRNPDNATGNPTARYRYDTLDRVTDITDVLGSSLGDPNHTTSLTYNNRGQLTVTTLAKDPVDNTRHTITNYYNPDGTLASKTNERYQSTSCTYDDYRRLRSVTPPVRGSGDSGTHITGYYYSAAGLNDDYRHTDVQPRWVVLPSGKKINTVYDDNLRKTSMTVALGTADAATTSYGYDNVGNVTSVVAPNQQPGQPFSGRSTSTAYDERNRPSSIADALNRATTFTYDTAGRKKSINRPNGQVITYNSFDLMNRVTQQTVQNSATQNAITKYNYYTIAHDGANAPVGLLRTMQDPYLVWTGSGDAYIYTYDTMGRKRSVTYPADAGGTHRIEYFVPDTVGRLWTYQNRNGNIQTFSYDALNRMSGFTWNDGSTPSVTFGYDTGSRLIEIDNANAHISRSYYNDDLLRVEHTEDANGNALGQVVYSYDEDGNRASAAVWPGNASFNYNYTGRNQLRALVDNNSGPTAYYWYDKNGNLTQRNPGNTTTTSYTPDALDRVTSIVHSLNGTTRTINYGYDTVSNNRKWIQRLITPTSAENNRGEVFSYDFADQVTAVQLDIQNPNTASAGNQTISYDPNGNRTRFQPPGHNEQYVTNNLNQYTSRNGTNAAYDTKGNLATGLDLSSYTYDAQNRLTGAIKSGVTEVFTYDGLNRQVSRNVGGVATYNVWDGWNLVAEYHDPASVLAKYVYGTGGLVKEMVSNNYYYQDGSGSTSDLANSSGVLQEWYRYDLQGTPFFYNSSDQMIGGSNAGVRHLFTGQQWYSELGLYDLRNRFYSPDIGRFLQPDPIGFRGGNNLYRYCGNNPVTRRDPFGLSGTPPTNVDPSPQYPTAVFPRVTVPGESPNTFWREPGGFGGPGGFVPSIGSDNPAAHRGYNPFPRPPPEDDQPSVQHPAPSSVPPQNPPPPQAPAPVSPASPSAPAAGVFSHWGQLASPIVSPEVNMRLDDDGSGPKHGDSKHQNFVSYYWFYGVNLNADTDAYVVAPRYALSQGVMLGDLAFVIGNATWTPAIVGDVGSSANGWGEVSLRTAWNLGVPTIDAPGGRGPVIPQSFGPVPVTIIVIPTRP
jgi:RHS repeat-associated protein